MVNTRRIARLARKDLQRLRKEAYKIIENDLDQVLYLLKYFSNWIHNHEEMVNLTFDLLDNKEVLADNFRLALRDLNLSMSQLEVEIIIILLDKEVSNLIDVKKIGVDIINLIKFYTPKLNRVHLTKTGVIIEEITEEILSPVFDKYIKVHFKNIPFLIVKKHPWHFEHVFPISSPIETLKETIRRRIDLNLPIINISCGANHKSATILEAEKTLKFYFDIYGSQLYPEKLKLFYDFTVGFVDCCIILANDCMNL